MIHLTIDANEAADLGAQLMGICKLICGVEAAQEVKPESAYQPKHAEPVAEVLPEDASYQPKHAEPVPVPLIVPDNKAAEAPAFNETDVRKALNEYRKARGATATRELLAKFGADSFPALHADKYAAVMEACNAAE